MANRISPDGPTRALRFHMTPYVCRIVDAVIASEKAKGNKRATKSSVMRRLIVMGFQVWRKTETMPGHER